MELLASKPAASFMVYCLEEECGNNVPVYSVPVPFVSDENWLELWLDATLVPQLFLLKTFPSWGQHVAERGCSPTY